MRLSIALIVTCTLGFGGAALAADPVLSCPAGSRQMKVTDKGSGSTTFKCAKSGKELAGLCHGAFLEQYSNGQTSASGQCTEGLMSGKWTYFTRDGVKTTEIEFAKGAYNGTRTEFFANGMPKVVEQYENGARVGQPQEFDVTGKPVQVVTR